MSRPALFAVPLALVLLAAARSVAAQASPPLSVEDRIRCRTEWGVLVSVLRPATVERCRALLGGEDPRARGDSILAAFRARSASIRARNDSLASAMSDEDRTYCRSLGLDPSELSFWPACSRRLRDREIREEHQAAMEARRAAAEQRAREEEQARAARATREREARCRANGTAALGEAMSRALCDAVAMATRDARQLDVTLVSGMARVVAGRGLDALEFAQMVCLAWRNVHGGSSVTLTSEYGVRLLTVRCARDVEFEWHLPD